MIFTRQHILFNALLKLNMYISELVDELRCQFTSALNYHASFQNVMEMYIYLRYTVYRCTRLALFKISPFSINLKIWILNRNELYQQSRFLVFEIQIKYIKYMYSRYNTCTVFPSEHKLSDGLGYKSHTDLFLATWKKTKH